MKITTVIRVIVAFYFLELLLVLPSVYYLIRFIIDTFSHPEVGLPAGILITSFLISLVIVGKVMLIKGMFQKKSWIVRLTNIFAAIALLNLLATIANRQTIDPTNIVDIGAAIYLFKNRSYFVGPGKSSVSPKY
jgi:hypothetical protein